MTEEISRKAYVDQAPPILAEILDLVVKGADYRNDAMNILHDTVRSLKRLASRAGAPAGFDRVEITQSHGPTLEFSGKLLADAEYESRGRDIHAIRLELWETAAGAWVAVTKSTPERGRMLISATVVAPGDDLQQRRLAIMAQFDWHDRARSMVRKLGWTLREDVA